MPLDDKLTVLVEADEAMRGDSRIAVTTAQFLAFAEERTFASTEGALCDQRVVKQRLGRAGAGSPGRRSKASTYPSALSGNPQQIMEAPGYVR